MEKVKGAIKPLSQPAFLQLALLKIGMSYPRHLIEILLA